MERRTKVFITFLASCVGILSLWLYTTLVQEVLIDGLSYCSSTRTELVMGTMGIFGAGLVAGFMASLIVVRSNYLPHILMSIFVLGKLCFVVVCDTLSGPLWYETSLGVALLSALWLGRLAADRFPLAPVS
ncbi:hypothetical protein [Allomuricauda sp. SCSIO 65647]|uniref:hypothetical protein n=1 Tax=Allomuricauda sp. SCSIO 65647 TaxID=2908843 RepID=UPI001F310CA2|nr:hypothetical protein [Muricauda sp. SCSIO 65647]UJH67504.1 hypothetical protein L0P89_16330 [Muricauda sp. SCSIO 65647]